MTHVDKYALAESGRVKRIFLARNKIIPKDTIAHITQRAPGKELLFLEENDYTYFLHLLKQISVKYKVKVLCFALMTNHFHLLVKFLEENASSAIKNLCERYAMYFNKKYERKGHVFCGAFRASLCFDITYLLSSSFYIHLNPLKAGLCSDSSSYRWSSTSLYTGPFSGKTFIDYKFILNLISENTNRAKKIYKEGLKNSAHIDIKSVLENVKALDMFRLGILPHLHTIFQKEKNKRYPTDEIEIENRIKTLRTNKKLKDPQEVKARKYLIEQLLSRGYTIADIGTRLAMSRQNVYRILKETS